MKKPIPNTIGPIGLLSVLLNIPETSLRLLISIILGYPIALIYNSLIKHRQTSIKHIYLALSGFFLCLFIYGYKTYHSCIAISVTYLLLNFVRQPRLCCIINLFFQMIHLIIGHLYNMYDDDITQWTPHCVLTLKLIGICFDISDGQMPGQNLPLERIGTAVNYIPSLLELAGFVYFPATFPIGGQMNFRRYKRFVQGEFDENPRNVETGFVRGIVGVIYLFIYRSGTTVLHERFFITRAFQASALTEKIGMLCVWSKIFLYKYIGCWLLAEGAQMCFGSTYNGNYANGEANWYASSDVEIKLFETAGRISDYFYSFNMTTNKWFIRHILLRLNFRGRRKCFFMFLFVAVVNGLYSGYFVTFIQIFLLKIFEQQFEAIFTPLKAKYAVILNSLPARLIYAAIKYIYVHVAISWCIIPYVYQTSPRYNVVYTIFNNYGYVFLATWFIGRGTAKLIIEWFEILNRQARING